VAASASAIRPIAQCSVQAARSQAALSASRFSRVACIRSSSRRALLAWRIMLAAWARHFIAHSGKVSGCRARRRQSFHCSEAATNCAAKSASAALAGASAATRAMAA